MPRPASDKRERLTAAAATLAYANGFEHTTIADVAEAADVPMGSVYYYFKTKDDVGAAVVESLQSRYRALLDQWNVGSNPRQRLTAYVHQYLRDAHTVAQHGCPIGSLCTELRKVSGDLGSQAAEIFRMTLSWATTQFVELGFHSEAAKSHAMELVTGIQGAAVLSNALDSTEPLERAAARLTAWLSSTTP